MVLDRLGLNDAQETVVKQIEHDLLVSAGAGTGKTRTLVARYLWLLDQGLSPRQVLAITFTEKAAREMRNRLRQAIGTQIQEAANDESQTKWIELEAVMDAARIGTIHSFCAEVMRSHPAEAAIDPLFTVVDEGMAATIKAQIVDDTLSWASAETQLAPLFATIKPTSVEAILTHLMNHRLEASHLLPGEAFDVHQSSALRDALEAFVQHPQVLAGIEQLRAMRAENSLLDDAGDHLHRQIEALLDGWKNLEVALAEGKLIDAAKALHSLRREHMSKGIGKKKSEAKRLVYMLRERYSNLIEPWLGGEKPGDLMLDTEVEALSLEILPLVGVLFSHAVSSYRMALDQRQGLDFDDLEAGALDLLENERIRLLWQEKISAVLVDEFQDTNTRQRAIVEALCGGTPGKLFVVGDARQSIYRFRGADVRVFRRVQQDIIDRGGKTAILSTTFRAPSGLLRCLDDLLPPIMGSEDIESRPFDIPYTRLEPYRLKPREGVEAPLVEFVLGSGSYADEARTNAAQALVVRLKQLRDTGQIRGWDEVALLFRAASGFEKYEDALQAAGIPYLTVAGTGFYSRPEIRDVLNILNALANPQDDLTMAGLLRSPAFGLKDSTLFRLRWGPEGSRPLLAALTQDLDTLDDAERARIDRARRIIDELLPLADRLPIAELLKLVVDKLDYRAVLASGHSRLWRNLDKLLVDAHESGAVQVRAFLEYLRTLRDVGAREGEAPAVAEGAVRLMTIHKAKGLEFEFVVIADASWRPRTGQAPVYLLEETGPALKLDRFDVSPLIYQLAKAIDTRQSQAEGSRLLYVASTRAKEKLLVSGHLSATGGGWSAAGWLKSLLEAMRVDPKGLADELSPMEVALPGGEPVRIWVGPGDLPPDAWEEEEALEWPTSKHAPLFDPVGAAEEDDPDPEMDEKLPSDWRATGDRLHAPAIAVGTMVHAAIQAWLFPQDKRLEALLDTAALEEGLVDPAQRKRAITQANKLLRRLIHHPLHTEIEAATERKHEVPYTLLLPDGRLGSGIIDLLYRSQDVWKIIDFKTDNLDAQEDIDRAVDEYRPQVARYVEAVTRLLRVQPKASICFLDAMGEVAVIDV